MKSKKYFKEVCILVEEGFTISQALDELEIDSTTFYKSITKEQKLMLGQLRTANKIYGLNGNGNPDTMVLHEFFTTNEYAY